MGGDQAESEVAGWDDIREIALSLPEAEEEAGERPPFASGASSSPGGAATGMGRRSLFAWTATRSR